MLGRGGGLECRSNQSGFRVVPVNHISGSFESTRWSLVLAAGEETSVQSKAALGELCARYWYPLYAYVRRRGFRGDEAQDLTQGFFARLLEKEIVRSADRDRGRFRSFLLGAMKNYLSDERDRAQALKRGGGRVTISRDAASDEARYSLEPSHQETPERLFERQWAVTVIELALADLRGQFEQEAKCPLFEAIKGYLTSDPPDGGQAELAAGLGMSPGALRVTIHRLRRRHREALRRQIESTVASPEEVEDEIRQLFGALAR